MAPIMRAMKTRRLTGPPFFPSSAAVKVRSRVMAASTVFFNRFFSLSLFRYVKGALEIFALPARVASG